MQAMETVKEFYSYHFAEDMSFSAEKLTSKEKYLTEDFIKRLSHLRTDGDVFTTGDTDFPRAFRVSACEFFGDDKVKVEVLLFWKDNSRSEQRKINVFVVKKHDSWFIDGVER